MKLFRKLMTATVVALALAATPPKADETTYLKEFTILGDVFFAQIHYDSWVHKMLPQVEDDEYIGFLYFPGQGNNVVPAHGARLVFRLTGWSKEEIEKLAYECQADMPCRGRWHISNFRHIDGPAFGWVDAAADLEGVNDHYEAPADAPRYFYDGTLVTPESRAQKGVEGRQHTIAMKKHDEASRKYQTCLENQINLVYKRDPRAPPMPLNYFKANIFPKCQDARSDYIASQDAFGMDNKTKELDENNILGLVGQSAGHSFDSDFRNARPTPPTPIAAPAPTQPAPAQPAPTLAAETAP